MNSIPYQYNLIDKQNLLINIDEFNEEKDLCMICVEIVTYPVQCKNCKTLFCKKCANKWRENKNVCPKKCSPKWQITQIGIKKFQLKCPNHPKCNQVIFIEDLVQHFKICEYSSESIKLKTYLQKNYLCKNKHQLTLNLDNYQYFTLSCNDCTEATLCRSQCKQCGLNYCMECRPLRLYKKVCPLKKHLYETETAPITFICDICGTRPYFENKSIFNDSICDIGICEDCYSNLQSLQNQQEIINQIELSQYTEYEYQQYSMHMGNTQALSNQLVIPQLEHNFNSQEIISSNESESQNSETEMILEQSD